MRKILLVLIIMLSAVLPSFAAKIPQEVRKVIEKDFNNRAEIRFDGLVTLPDSTVYLPLFPALVKKIDNLTIKKTYPENKKFTDLPDIVIFDTDFVLLKIIKDEKGNKTVSRVEPVPIEIKTGLLPQDLLVPKGLVIPISMKGIIGALQIPTKDDPGIRVKSEMGMHLNPIVVKTGPNLVKSVPELKNKIWYVATCYSKNIHVIEGEKATPEYALAQKSIPIDMKATPDNKFLLVTVYENPFVDVVSLKDEQVIKKIDLKVQPDEIIMDKENQKAYVSSSEDSSIFVIDLKTMLLKQKIKVNGRCERLYLSSDSSKLFYNDKNTGDIWVIDTDNDYTITNFGKFPNVSKIVFAQNKIYLLSRSKNHVAIVDYFTRGLIQEFEVPLTPVDMIAYRDDVLILSGNQNVVTVLRTKDDVITSNIYLNTRGFSTKLYPLKGTNLIIVSDTKAGKYSVLDMVKKQVIKTNTLLVPVSSLEIVEKK